MVMKPTPVAAFIMIQPYFILEFLVVTFDTPAEFCQAHQRSHVSAGWYTLWKIEVEADHVVPLKVAVRRS